MLNAPKEAVEAKRVEKKQPKRVTVGDLIAGLKTLPPGSVVKMSSDPEGNCIRYFDVVSVESEKEVCFWPGAEVES